MGRGDLTNEEWARLKPHLPKAGRRGGRWASHRRIIDGILHRNRTGMPWRDLPARSGKWKTVYDLLPPQPPLPAQTADQHTILEPKNQRANRKRRGSKGGRPAGFDKTIYKRRNEVERTILALKNSRAVATRFDKRAYVFDGTVTLASIRLWLRA